MVWRLQGFDADEFVNRYWQKRPCLLRGVLAEFESPVSPEELAGLACEDGVHSRLVIERGGDRPWQVRYGPFEESDFTALPASHYSLLVSDCEKWLPELADLLDQFRFIPDWRIDDLMVSYAPSGGSVGAHVDEYDVFLLQALGRRRWQYSDERVTAPQLVDGLELALLDDFAPDQDVVLEPGDMLYLPPGIAHHGVALERCMTYSIGFRAPSASDVLGALALEAERRDRPGHRYRDPDLECDREPAEITRAEVERLRALASELLDESGELWCDAIGKLLSDSPVARDAADEPPFLISDLQAGAWAKHPETRILYYADAGEIRCYYNGRVHAMPSDTPIQERLRAMCARREWSREFVASAIEVEPLARLLLELADHGAIFPVDE